MPPFVYTCASSFTHARWITLHVIRDTDSNDCYVVVNFFVNKPQRLLSSKEEICKSRNYHGGNPRASELLFSFDCGNQRKPEHCPYTAQPGDTLMVHYVVRNYIYNEITCWHFYVRKGALENGQVFDTSKQEGRTPFELVLGQGSVIKGKRSWCWVKF